MRKDVKMIGKRGIMGTSFELSETNFRNGNCDEGNELQSIKHVYEIQGEPKEDNGVKYYTARPSAVYVMLYDNKFNEKVVSCGETQLESEKFYDVK